MVKKKIHSNNKIKKVFCLINNFCKRFWIYIIICIIIGVFLGNYFAGHIIQKPIVGIIKIDGDTSRQYEDLVELIRSIRENASIKAVVFEINSPGGEALGVEELYMSIVDLRSEKPVVASVDNLGASGAYYIAIASNFIYAKPSSKLGSIGVVTVLPKTGKIDETKMITGPYKKREKNIKDRAVDVQQILENFLRAVTYQRGDRLKLSKDELEKAKIYSGIDALRRGMIDDLGTTTDAIRKAAELAKLRYYEIQYLNKKKAKIIIKLLSINESVLEPTNTIPVNYFYYVQ